MADLPYMKFFTGDWLRDTRFLSVETKGAWIDTLAVLWDSRTRGLLSHPVGGWARLWGCSESMAGKIIDELGEVAEVFCVFRVPPSTSHLIQRRANVCADDSPMC